jgi:hypothetical protein
MGAFCKRPLLAAVLAVLVAGCAHQLGIGEEQVVEKSGSRPAWTKAAEPVVEEQGRWLFRGIVTRAPSLEMALRQAEADAKKRLVGQVSELIQSEFSQYATSTGNSQPSQFVADGISWASQRVAVSGAHPAKSYWERVEVREAWGVEYFWRAWCLLEVSAEDLAAAKSRAAEALKEQLRRPTDRKAEEEGKRLRDKLDEKLDQK